MADNDTSQLEVAQEVAPEGKSSSKAVAFLLLLLIAAAIWFFYNIITGDDTQRADNAPVDSRFLNVNESQKGTERDNAVLGEVDEAFNVSGATSMGVFIKIEQELESYKQEDRREKTKQRQENEQLQREVKQLSNDLTKLKSQLVKAIDDQNYNRSLNRRRGTDDGPVNADFPDMPFDEEGGDEFTEQADAFPYFSLRKGVTAGEAADETFDIVTDAVSNPFADESSADIIQPKKEDQNIIEKVVEFELEEDKPEEFITRRVPAFSWANVTTLHGVSCPTDTHTEILANIFPAGGLPVIVPIQGVFNGPEGAQHDLRGAHLFGFCFGQEGQRPTAYIKIERLSYIGPDGEAKLVNVNGYVADRRDNRAGIAGILETNKVKNVLLSATAGGIAGAAGVSNLGNFNQTQTSDGKILSTLKDGRTTNALGGSFLDGGLNKTAELIASYGERQISLVHVSASTPVTFYLTQEVEYLDDNTEATEDYYDEPLL